MSSSKGRNSFCFLFCGMGIGRKTTPGKLPWRHFHGRTGPSPLWRAVSLTAAWIGWADSTSCKGIDGCPEHTRRAYAAAIARVWPAYLRS